MYPEKVNELYNGQITVLFLSQSPYKGPHYPEFILF